MNRHSGGEHRQDRGGGRPPTAERDNFMTAEEAVEYGLIDKVIDHR